EVVVPGLGLCEQEVLVGFTIDRAEGCSGPVTGRHAGAADPCQEQWFDLLGQAQLFEQLERVHLRSAREKGRMVVQHVEAPRLLHLEAECRTGCGPSPYYDTGAANVASRRSRSSR